MKARLTTLAFLVVAAATIAAGCGGSDSSSGSGGESGGSGLTTSSLSKDEYVKVASEACTREREDLYEELTRFLQKGQAQGVPDQILNARMVKEVIAPTIEAEIRAVRKLGAPEGDEEEVAAILAAQRAAVDKVKKLKTVVTNEDYEKQFTDATKMYRDYGFTTCTNSP